MASGSAVRDWRVRNIRLSTNPLTAAAATIACTTTDLLTAISAANKQVGGGTVSLAPGCTYTMTVVNNSVDGNNAFPDIVATSQSSATQRRSRVRAGAELQVSSSSTRAAV